MQAEENKEPKGRIISHEVIPISMDEYVELRNKGGIDIKFYQSNEDIQNNTITFQIDHLRSLS